MNGHSNGGELSAVSDLLQYSENIYSQAGEDGIIRRILQLLPNTDGWCVEFGAWDGKHLSNTRRLIEQEGYSAVLIEAEAARYRALQRTYAGKAEVITLRHLVGFAADTGLDAILSRTPIPRAFDFLSIDIDGNDYHVWRSTSVYRPKVVCIEFNPTIPTDVRFVQPADPTLNQGSSLRSLVDLGMDKGYELIAVTSINAFFVRSEFFGIFGIANNDPALLRRDLSAITQLFTGYDGTVFLTGSKKLPWLGIDIDASDLQCVPRIFRIYPGNYGVVRKLLFAAYLGVRRPKTLRAILRRKRSLAASK